MNNDARRATRAAGQAILDRLPNAFVVVDDGARPVVMNARAREALSRGVPLDDEAVRSHPVDCVRIDENNRGDYGAFKNVCDYPVSFVYCVQEPKSGWSKYISCNPDSPRMGVDGIAARGIQAAFVKGEAKVHWFACRKPKSPIARFDGRQIVGTCK